MTKRVEIDVASDDTSLEEINLEVLEQAVEDMWSCLPDSVEGVIKCRFSLSFVDKEVIKEINGRYRGIDEPTDVLSFPLWEEKGTFVPPRHMPVVELGDVVVCPEVVEENAPINGKSYGDELLLVIVHGFLHLIGMDHCEEREKEHMWRLQEKIIDKYKELIK